MERLSAKSAKKYLIDNYGECRHNATALAKACQKTAKEFGVKSVEIFHFVVENSPVGYSHSYGFHTAHGRAIMDTFKHYYYHEYNS